MAFSKRLASDNWYYAVAFRILVLCHLHIPLSFAGRDRGPFNYDRPHTHPHHGGERPYVDLCETFEGLEGECHPLSKCWVTNYDNIRLKPCQGDVYNEFYCCPDLPESNVEVVPPNRQLPHTEKPVDNQQVFDPVRDLLSLVGSWIQRRPAASNSGHSASVVLNVVSTRIPEYAITRSPIRRTTLHTNNMPVPPTSPPIPLINRPIISINRPIPPINQPVPSINRPIPPTRRPVPPTRRPVPPTRRPFPPTRRPISPSRRPIPPTRWPIPPTIRPIPPTRPTVLHNTESEPDLPFLEPNFQQECGQRSHKYSDMFDKRHLGAFVLGGTDAEENSWPWMVSIHSSKSGRIRFLCGGSIITSRHILTAAHCFDGRTQGSVKYLVNFGSNNLTSLSDGHGTLRVGYKNVINVRVHELYKPRVYYHDIAVLTLDDDLPLGDSVLPICLPTVDDLEAVNSPVNVSLTGWGQTTYGGVHSTRLQEALLQIIPFNRCEQSYGNFKTESLFQGITTNMMCAGLPEGGVDACQGDSGGPLAMENSGKWIQIGVVSFGFRCGVKDFPGVYTRVSSYMNWINRVLAEL